MKEDLHTYIDESEMADYYGPSVKKPENFKFLPGDRKMLSQLADTSKKLVSASLKRPLQLSSGLGRKRSKSSTSKLSRSDSNGKVEINDVDEDDEDNAIFVNKSQSLVDYISAYIKQNVKNLSICTSRTLLKMTMEYFMPNPCVLLRLH